MSGDLEPVRLRLQVRAAESGVSRLRYIGYSEAEAAVERLALLLVQRFGAEPLRRFLWTALPRGGLIVLGMLASRLDLPAGRLAAGAVPGEGADDPLVVVDDCALSGARFAAFLAGCPARQVVFAPLYSPPALRAAIESREPRVLACVAAHDLEDGGIGERWRERLEGDRYGPGTGDRIAFPWNEPDRLIWNPEAREVELGWKLVPPERCLKQRSWTGSAARPRLQIQPRGAGPWRPASTVLFGWRRGATIVHRLDSGQVFHLRGTAHAMWWALLRGGELEPALRLLLDRYHVGEETLAADLAGFLQTLREQDLLERTSANQRS